ncbi:glycosyltransferase [Sphingobium sp. AP49]|uniref:glycosyltransferase n=1 Tax=Sphingobium sp. AP49 TaxID=1144307 RepID=UPI00026EDFDD|nr:glycosyltransferase [Sphingobium sp. AP49]WHO39967.1 glycosyltransferase [Sphingobium sp. AP49]
MASSLPLPPRVAIVVPAFRHPTLVGEAIEAALEQEAPFGIMLVLVNDGCPHPETDDICREYASAYPDRVRYVRKPNGGLSSARNAGIRYVLAHLPGVEAIYFLDADNRLRPHAIAKAMATLDAHPDAGWVYPSIDMFGLAWHGDMGGDYSRLIHTDTNISEAGSLVHRRVFEAGILFDEGFTLGWEDWDFFLTAAEQGFVGVNCEDFGFLYRKRPESMLANSERDHATIRSMMHAKHHALMHPKNLAALEQSECPRFAIILHDSQEVIWALDPLAADTRQMEWSEYQRLFALHATNPNRHFAPPITIVTTTATFTTLADKGLLHWTFWRTERALQAQRFAAMALDMNGVGRIHFSHHNGRTGADALRVDLFGLMTSTLVELVTDNSPSSIDALAELGPGTDLWSTRLSMPAEASATGRSRGPDMFDAFLQRARTLRLDCYNAAWAIDWDWRRQTSTPRRHTHLIARNAFHGAPAYPWAGGKGRNVGFILPLVEFGGVEKVAINLARGLRAHGWHPHLIVVGATDIRMPDEWRQQFDTISFLDDPDCHIWDENDRQYFGTSVPHWATGNNHAIALGMLYWLDVAIGFHAGGLLGVMGQLRRWGVRTVTSLHVSDQTSMGRPKGNTYLATAFEHAIDLFAPCSLMLADWCRGMGIPPAKIVPVQNVAGYDESQERLAALHHARRARPIDAPLRILFLGRFDGQKGIDHLSRIYRETVRYGLNVEWRIIGKSVIGGDGYIAPADLQAIAEAPLISDAELTNAYGWADVLLLPSLYEGLPLTVLEAMRAGVVPIVTDVGAVREVVTDAANGFILPKEGLEMICLDRIKTLADDRDLLHRLAGQAYADRSSRTWQQATEQLSQRLLC